MYVGSRRGNKPRPVEKAAITTACERLIAEQLRQRFLPQVRRSTKFNYAVATEGKWLGNKYRFFTRYHWDDPASLKTEFDVPLCPLGLCRPGLLRSHVAPAHRRMALRGRAPVADGSVGSDCERAVFPTLLSTGFAPTSWSIGRLALFRGDDVHDFRRNPE